jgi:HEAT repeat protein
VLDELAAFLRNDPNRTVRYRAATVLSWIAAERFAYVLLAALADASGGVRVVAAKALADIKDSRAIPLITELLRRSEWGGRTTLAEVLIHFGEPAVPPLIALLADERPHSRYWAIYILGRLGDPRAVEPLISLMRQEGEAWLRNAVIAALGQLGNAVAAPAVIEALTDPALRASAARSLGRIGDARAIVALLSALADHAPDAAYAPHTQHAASQRAMAEFTRRSIGSALVTLARSGTGDIFLDALRNGAPEVQPWAVAALAKIGGRGALDWLLTTLHDPQAAVRVAAAEALGKLDEAQVVGPLIQAMGDTDATVRVSAATALSRLGHRGGELAISTFIVALDDVDNTVRSIAARTLGALGDARAVDPLIRTLSGPACPQSEIVAALATLGDARAVAPLIQLVLSPPLSRCPQSYYASIQAMRVLAELGGTQVVEPLIQVLAEAPPDPDDKVRSGYYWSRRGSVIDALSKLGDPRAVEPLIAALGNDEGGSAWSWERWTKVKVAEALGQIGDPRALRALAQVQHPCLPSDSVGRPLNQAAVRSIRRLRERRARQNR